MTSRTKDLLVLMGTADKYRLCGGNLYNITGYICSQFLFFGGLNKLIHKHAQPSITMRKLFNIRNFSSFPTAYKRLQIKCLTRSEECSTLSFLYSFWRVFAL